MKQKIERVKEISKKNYRWIICAICMILIAVLIENIMSNDIITLDEKGYNVVVNYLMTEDITFIIKCITNLASAYWLISLTLILTFAIKDKKIGISIFVNLGLSTIINFIVKNIIQRPRPIENRLIEESGYSFPSGHSMVSLAFYGFLIYLIFKKIDNKNLRTLLIIVLSLAIISIGISRIYLGVHYLSDVIGGFLFALAYLMIYTNVLKKYIEI